MDGPGLSGGGGGGDQNGRSLANTLLREARENGRKALWFVVLYLFFFPSVEVEDEK
jgi:hypothetical protein